MEMFHLGHLYPRPVTVNIVREGIATPIPTRPRCSTTAAPRSSSRCPSTSASRASGCCTPLNRPDVMDEVVAFLGASYFRFLGRAQRYGISARGLAVGTGLPDEEFPFYREFWVEAPGPRREPRHHLRACSTATSRHGRLPLRSRSGRRKRDGGRRHAVPASRRREVRDRAAHLHVLHQSERPPLSRATSGRNCTIRTACCSTRAPASGSGARCATPLPSSRPSFTDSADRGLRAAAARPQLRGLPGPRPRLRACGRAIGSSRAAPWGEGRVELVELPTADETNDNIVACWLSRDPVEAGKPHHADSYTITASLNLSRLSPGGRVGQHVPDPGPLARVERGGGARARAGS